MKFMQYWFLIVKCAIMESFLLEPRNATIDFKLMSARNI